MPRLPIPALLLLAAASAAPLSALAGPSAELVLVETPFEARESTVLLRDVASGSERRLATIAHAPGYGAQGELSPTGDHLALSVLEGGNRTWRHAAVYVVALDPERPAEPRRVLGEAVLSSPLWVDSGRLLAVRSVGEHEPSPVEARRGRLMDLDLEIVLLERTGGTPRVLLRDRCYGLELVGPLSTGEIGVIRSSAQGSSLWAMRVDGTSRQVAHLGPGVAAWAHRAPEGDAVVFQQLIDRRPGVWAVSRISLDGHRSELARLAHPFVAPVPLQGGLVAYTSADGSSIELLEALGKGTRTLWRDPSATRLVSARASTDGRWLIAERVAQGPARTFVIEVSSGQRFDAGGERPRRWRTAMGLRSQP
ncbi:MAG: hypothetical protein HY901_31775 [Deltaproteobacteria bacterium]|nr:hypothetical protein [Deltaproteobacteria bacterium]